VGGSHQPTSHERISQGNLRWISSGGYQKQGMGSQRRGGSDYIRKWIGSVNNSDSPPPSLLGLIVPLSCLRRSRLLPPPLSLSRHKPCSTSTRFVSHTRLPCAISLTASPTQFEVTTPHVVYACLGGFVVLVRSPLSLSSDKRGLMLGTSSACSHSSFERRCDPHLFAWITNRAQRIHSSTLENLSGRSSSGLSSVCLKYLSSEPHLSHSLGPYGAGVFDPRSWGDHKTETNITLELTRVVLAIGVFAIGVELPKAYMRQHWKSLMFLLIPVMTWVCNFPPSPCFNSYTLLLGLVRLRWAHLRPYPKTQLPFVSGRCRLPHPDRPYSCCGRRGRKIRREARPGSYPTPPGSRVWLQRRSCIPLLVHCVIPHNQRNRRGRHCTVVPRPMAMWVPSS